MSSAKKLWSCTLTLLSPLAVLSKPMLGQPQRVLWVFLISFFLLQILGYLLNLNRL